MTGKDPSVAKLRQARELLACNPHRSLKIAETLAAKAGSSPRAGEVFGFLGLVRHTTGDLSGAHSAFDEASRREESELARGHVLRMWALLELDRRRYDEALRKANRGLALIEGAEPSYRDVAQGYLSRGIVFRHCERYDDAESDYRKALRLIHPKKDADLHFKALQNLSLALLFGAREPRRVERALKTLDVANRQLRRYRIRLKSLQNASVLWIRGLAYRIVGADERAETLMSRAREILFELGALTEWTRLSLDVTEIYMHYGKWGMVKRTLGEILDHTQDAEVLAVIAVFYDAIRADAVTVTEDVVERVYSTVHGDQRLPPSLGLAEAVADTEPIGF